MKDFFKILLFAFVIIILLFSLLIGLGAIVNNYENKEAIKLYNNGICSKCGGTYYYSQAVGHKSETYYIYICDTCNDLIEVNTYWGK